MVNKITLNFYIIVAILFLFSCKKNLPTLDIENANVSAPSADAKTDWNGIADDDHTTVFMNYKISPVNLGVNPPLKYMIEVDTALTFEKSAPIVIFVNISKDTSIDILVSSLDSLLKAKYNAKVGSSYTIYIRTRVNVLNQNNVIVDSLFSSANKYEVGPIYGASLLFEYYNIPNDKIPRIWWLVGGMTTDAWQNVANKLGSGLWPLSLVDGLVYNADGDGIFEGTFYFATNDEFKIIRDPGTWEPAWGTSDGAMNMTFRPEGASDVQNVKISSPGWYKIVLNSIENICTITSASAPVNSYTNIGMVGTINNWGTSTDILMTPIQTSRNHIWYTSYTFLATEEVKFRENNTWTNSWGGIKVGGSVLFPVSLKGGEDFLVPKSSYTILFNDIDGCSYFLK